MHVATLTTPSGASREFILGHPQQYDTGEWYLNLWPVDEYNEQRGEDE